MKYTPAEVAALLANRPNQPHYVKALIEKCVKAAVLAEREQCALAAWEVVQYEVHADLADQVAQAIRARGDA